MARSPLVKAAGAPSIDEIKAGEIDNKTADALNTTVKTAIELNQKLPLKALALLIQARVKKIDLPVDLKGLLPS